MLIQTYVCACLHAGKKEETKRLKEFVQAAYNNDPRIIQKRENDRLEK